MAFCVWREIKDLHICKIEYNWMGRTIMYDEGTPFQLYLVVKFVDPLCPYLGSHPSLGIGALGKRNWLNPDSTTL